MSAELLLTLELDIIEDALRNHGDENGVNLDGILDKVLALNASARQQLQVVRAAKTGTSAMTATDADLQELVSALQVQLRDVTRERDAYRKWAEEMPLRATVDEVVAWMAQRPQPPAGVIPEGVSDLSDRG